MNGNEHDPIVDAMLDEWLGKRKPKAISLADLRAKEIDPRRALELVQALKSASADVSLAATYRKSKSRHRRVGWLVAMAACLLIGVGIWGYRHREQFRGWGVSQESIARLDSSLRDMKSSVADPPMKEEATLRGSTESEPKKVASAAKTNRETLPMSSLPFSTDVGAGKDARPLNDSKSVAAKLNEEDLIGVIDYQMQQIWKSRGAQPSAPIPGLAWIDRAAKRILSREASESEKETFARSDSRSTRLDWLRRAVESPEFAQVWARQLAAFYLDLDSITMRDATPDLRAFVQWIRKELNQSHRLDKTVQQIVLASGIEKGTGESSPSVYWWSEVGSRGKTSTADVLTSHFLGLRGTCAQCHDAGEVAGSDRASYWGIAAIAQGIEVSISPETAQRTVAFREDAGPLFYERSDATMVAAIPSLPNGQALTVRQGTPGEVKSATQKNLSALQDWIVQSDGFASSQANFVWRSLFGRGLLSDFPLSDDEGGREREDLAAVLGQQLRSYDFDLRKIVVWLAASQAFSLESVRHDGKWYLEASDKEIALHQRRQALFASFPTATDPSIRALDKLAFWMRSSSLNGGDRGEALANPLPPALLGNGSKSANEKAKPLPKATQFSEAQVEFLVSSSSLPQSLRDEVDRLIRSNLDWEALVDHAFYMTGTSLPTPSDRQAARQILEISRDKRVAICRLIAARL